MHVSNRPEQFVRSHILQQIRYSPGPEGAADVFFTFEHREHDHTRGRILSADGPDSFETGHAWQLQIHQRDVGADLCERGDRLFAGRNGARYLHVLLTPDDRGDALADHGVIIDTQDSYGADSSFVQGTVLDRLCEPRMSQVR